MSEVSECVREGGRPCDFCKGEDPVIAHLLVAVHQPPLLNDHLVEPQFRLGSLHDAFLHRVLCDEPKDAHHFGLANPVSTVLTGGRRAGRQRQSHDNKELLSKVPNNKPPFLSSSCRLQSFTPKWKVLQG